MKISSRNSLTLRVFFLFACFSLVFWYKLIFLPKGLLTGFFLRYFFPYMSFFSSSIRSGVFPLWNPFLFCGAPFMANLQSMVFYPFSYLFVIFSFNSAVALFIVIHSMLAGMFAYLFFRRLGLDFLAAASGAVLWAFNGYFILHTYFLSNVAAYVWLPLVLLFFDYSITGNDIRFMPLTSLSLTIQFFGGYPLFSVITIIIMFFYGVIISAKDWSSLFNFFLKYILTLALFLLFSAVQLLPALELISNSVRAAGFAYETASVYSIHPLDFLKFLFLPLWNRVSPEISGDPSIIGFYFGWIAIILGTAGFTNKQLRKYVILFFVIFVISVLLSLGKYTPVHKWIYNTLPGFGLIRFAGQYIYTASFCATALVALGMAQIGGVKLKIVLFIILSVDLWLFSHYSIFTVSKDFYETLPENVEFLKKDNSHFRIYMTPRTRAQNIQPGKDIYGLWEKYRDSLYPNLSMAYGICDASGYEELRPAYIEKILNRAALSPYTPWLDLMNVKYVSSFWQLPKDKFKPVKSRHINIYLNKKCLPRVAFSNKPVIIRDSDVFEAIDSNKINLLKEFVLSAILYNIGKQENVSISRGEVHITDYSVNEITINAISSKGGWVILSDAWYPGWKVYVNGRPEKIYKVNYFMRGLMIKEGNSQIRMIYRPFSFKLGLWISVVSFSAVLFMILYPLIFGNILNDLIGFLDTKRYF